MGNRTLDLIVGLFVLVAALGLFYIAFEASSIHMTSSEASYEVTAGFEDIGSLAVRAPVRIAGVKIGEVVSVELDKNDFKAIAHISINSQNNNIPADSSISIMTEGLLGAKYLSISPGFDTKVLSPGDSFENTHSAFILENLIGKLLFQT